MEKYDVFISYNSQDSAPCLELAQRLHADGIGVWLDKWKINPGDNILSAIDEGLQNSRKLMLLLSPNALGSDWTELERTSRQFRDPANQGRGFIPVLLDVCELPHTLAPFKFIDYCSKSEQSYLEIRAACSPSIRVSRDSEIPTLVVGDLANTGWDEAISLWYDRLEPHERQQVLVDMSGCDHIHSRGFAFLFSLHKRVRENNGRMALYSPQPAVQSAMKMMRVDKLLDFFDSREEASNFVKAHDE